MLLENKRVRTKRKSNKFKFKALMVASVMLLSSCGTVSEHCYNSRYMKTKEYLKNETKPTALEKDMPEIGTISLLRIKWGR